MSARLYMARLLRWRAQPLLSSFLVIVNNITTCYLAQAQRARSSLCARASLLYVAERAMLLFCSAMLRVRGRSTRGALRQQRYASYACDAGNIIERRDILTDHNEITARVMPRRCDRRMSSTLSRVCLLRASSARVCCAMRSAH